jgi:hypothetical protein
MFDYTATQQSSESDVACGRGRNAGAAAPRLPSNWHAAIAVKEEIEDVRVRIAGYGHADGGSLE